VFNHINVIPIEQTGSIPVAMVAFEGVSHEPRAQLAA
jgi:hypothetical protein